MFLSLSVGPLNVALGFSSGKTLSCSLVLVVGVCCLIYSSYYMSSEMNLGYYLLLMLLFTASMILLVISGSLMPLLLGWEYLGITSFFLILFYQSWESYSNSMVTLMTMRLGDLLLFMVMAPTLGIPLLLKEVSLLVNITPLVLLVVAFTKSAQLPFSGWLPKAMSAPTPTSSLVHSSTLVASGFMLMSCMDVPMNTEVVLVTAKYGGWGTMFIGSLLAITEPNVKKVVAYSTLSQMGLIMLTYGLGLFWVGVMHLIAHGLAKSLLFMCVGHLLHTQSGQQESRKWNSSSMVESLVLVNLVIALFSLCGLFFMSGMLSKELMLSFMLSSNHSLVMSLGVLFSIFMTFIYSYYLWVVMLNKSLCFIVKPVGTGGVSLVYATSSLTVTSVSALSWLFTNVLSPSYYFMSLEHMTPLLFIVMALCAGYYLVEGVMNNFLLGLISNYASGIFIYKTLRLNLMNVKGVEVMSYHLLILGSVMATVLGIWTQMLLKMTRGEGVYFLLLVLLLCS